MAHLHKVYDSDVHFKIDATTRTAINESDIKKVMLIQNDHNSERFTFELPRYIEEHDMTLCDVVEIHYINTDSKTKETSKDVYRVDDMQVFPDDENVAVLSWLISRNATKYVGNLSFLICFKCLDGTEIEYMWSTAIYSKIVVGTSINNSEQVVEMYSDVLEEWEHSILEAANDAASLVDQSVDKYMTENPVVVEMQAANDIIQYSMGDDNWKDIIPIADLKGEKGDKGDVGEQGIQGETGVGIQSIEQIVMSEEDDGENVFTVTLTDGTTSEITIQNGSKGSQGIQGEQGIQGIQGEIGVGVQSVEQTTKSEEDEGDNVITVTLTDGSEHTFTVQNGSKGSTGKSAYEAAKDGGYTGDEEEFATKMAESVGNKIIGVLPAGETEITLTDEIIKADSRLDVAYTSIFGVPLQSAIFEAGSITLTFPAQEEDMTVMVVVDSTIANGVDGKDGADGVDGKDGVSPTATVEQVDETHAKIIVTDANGTTEAIIEGGGGGDYLPINNPVATGSFSLGRKEGSTVGGNSFAHGYKTEASGQDSYAGGIETKATGRGSCAEGYNTTASSEGAHSEGQRTKASGFYAHAEGYWTTADGEYTHAEGSYTNAKGKYSHAEGHGSKSYGQASHAEGYYTLASGDYQHTQGKYNIEDTEGIYAHIVGNGYYADGTEQRSNAHTLDWNGNAWFAGDVTATDAEGNSVSLLNLASNAGGGGDYLPIDNPVATGSFSLGRKADTTVGENSFAMGKDVTASGKYSVALGEYTVASSTYAFARGFQTVARASGSYAEGTETIAASNDQHVQGRYNIEDNEGQYAHIVGNGDNSVRRANIHTLDWSGNAWFAGDVTITDSTGNTVSLADVSDKLGLELTGTLTAGETTLVLENSKITTDSMIDIYASVYGIAPTAVEVVAGSITLTFGALENDVVVKVVCK